MFAITDLFDKNLGSHVLSPIIGVSLLCLFIGVFVSLRQNRKLQQHRAVYFAAGPAIPRPVETPAPATAPTGAGHAVNIISADPAELTLLHAIQQCLPAGYTTLNGLRSSDLLRWEGGSAPSASLTRERIDCVLCHTRTGTPCGVILITDTRSPDPMLNPALASTGLPVLHLEARREWTPAQLAYMLQEGLGLTPAA